MNVSYLLKYLFKRKWLILIPTLVAALLAWVLSRNQAAEYTSIAELSTGYINVNPLDYNSGGRNNTVLFNNVIQTLQSNQILDQVSYALLLHDLQSNTPFASARGSRPSEIVNQFPGGKRGLLMSLSNKADSFYVLDLGQKEDRMIRELADKYGYSPDALLNGLKVSRLEGSDFIMITTTTNNSALSAFIANQICRRFLALYQNRLGQASATSLDTLQNLVETKKQILDNKLKLLQDGSDPTINGSIGMLGTLQEQLAQQKNNLIAAQVALENISQQISAAGKQGGLANNEEIIALRTDIDNLYAKYVNGGSKDVNLLHQIDQLRSSLQQKLSTMGGGMGGSTLGDLVRQKTDLQVKINVAKQTMKDLQGKISNLQGVVQTSAAKQSVLQGIQSDVEIARQQYENANKLYNDALNRNIFPGNDFRQVLQASPSLYPNPSKKTKVIGFAGAGVFFFVIFLLLFIEFIDPAIKTPAYLKENISFPVVANFKHVRISNSLAEKMFSENNLGFLKGFKDQVKQLRYEVEHAGHKRIVFVGYHAGSGRTTIIECLARGLSLNNRKVLMVDANFHNNTLTRKYNAKALLESYEYPHEQPAVNQGIAEIEVSTGFENVSVIGCVSGDYSPAEVLPQRNLFMGLKYAEDYNYILIDCASLSWGPDCKELLRYADAVVLVFSANQPFTEEDKKLMSFLERDKIEVIGAVLNQIPEYNIDA